MALTSVQTAVFDTFGALYAGQVSDYGSNSLESGIRSFRAEGSPILGRGVVKGTVNTQDGSILTPFGVKTPLAGSVLADVVGIAVLNDVSISDANNNPTTVRDNTMIAVAERGSKVIIGAKVPAGITIVHGDPVFMSVSHASIPVGEFSNAAATGLIAITGATWYGAAAATTVGRIFLG